MSRESERERASHFFLFLVRHTSLDALPNHVMQPDQDQPSSSSSSSSSSNDAALSTCNDEVDSSSESRSGFYQNPFGNPDDLDDLDTPSRFNSPSPNPTASADTNQPATRHDNGASQTQTDEVEVYDEISLDTPSRGTKSSSSGSANQNAEGADTSNSGADNSSSSEEGTALMTYAVAFFLVIASVLGSGILGLPVKLAESGFAPFLLTYSIGFVMQVLRAWCYVVV
jgi:hypothetical protein